MDWKQHHGHITHLSKRSLHKIHLRASQNQYTGVYIDSPFLGKLPFDLMLALTCFEKLVKLIASS